MTDLSFLDQQEFTDWIVAQRWFASKTREVSQIEIVDSVTLREESPLLVLCLLEARFPTGTHETYQVPLGLRPVGEGWNERVIVRFGGWTVYDALADPAAGRELLRLMRSDSEFQVGQDQFIFRWAPHAPTQPGDTADVRPVGVEQSNSSIIFGDELIMKAFRKVEPGVNPELELLRFL